MARSAPLYDGDQAILATMHGKERIIAPLACRFVGLSLEASAGLDTDRFGTFSREVARAGSQLDAARAKIAAAFDLYPDIGVALASEGSFGPHPYLPFCALNREIVVLRDRRNEWELIGHNATSSTNFAHTIVRDSATGLAFAERAGFPTHGMIVMGIREGEAAPDLMLFKEIDDQDELIRAIDATLEQCGSAFLETDMRAHRNPRRMRAIGRAMVDLVRKTRSACPECARPGFAVSKRLAGLPCAWCGDATLLIRADVWACAGCGLLLERPVEATHADPGHCPGCNP
ncbi:hypothetical protein KV697_01520 [Sphingomonas sanguinis]|uniref:DUF6671 domain-containing protein n=1 Tax=Sphingomonas sanguinis TaxID=33051 RepID=A0ABU5LKG7_9SPHN|nr:DUF6671 family protein [Sphingomonas sanguinis]MDZ7280418.1 hypothetical protein [Sphingomonas sanguinis]QXT36086.1 hypothetical protein KV697_01520 [Sphingomonas sanguinis]